MSPKKEFFINITIGLCISFILGAILLHEIGKPPAEEPLPQPPTEIFEIVKEGHSGIIGEVKILHEVGTDALWFYIWGGTYTGGPAIAPYETGWWCNQCSTIRYENIITFHKEICK